MTSPAAPPPTSSPRAPEATASSGGAIRSLSDRELGRRAGQEDCRHCWHILYERSHSPLRQYALSLGVEEDQADDLVQDTMLRAWQSRHRYDAHYPYHRWVRTILFRLATTDRTRRRSREESLTSQAATGEGEWQGEGGDDVLEATLRSLLRDQISEVLESMPRTDRHLLVAWSEGARISDVAREWEENPATLRTRLFRAKRRFAELYRAMYPRAAEEGQASPES